VFEAWCRPELMARWFFPAPGWRAEVSADVQVGGRYRVTMFDPTGGAHVQEGVYQSIQPHHRLVFTWTCTELGVPESLVTVELGDRGEQTEIALHHELPDDPTILREHEGGWNGCLDSLARYFTT
jgi:uncharacterized protein YndB with AHSA1/START domain